MWILLFDRARERPIAIAENSISRICFTREFVPHDTYRGMGCLKFFMEKYAQHRR